MDRLRQRPPSRALGRGGLRGDPGRNCCRPFVFNGVYETFFIS